MQRHRTYVNTVALWIAALVAASPVVSTADDHVAAMAVLGAAESHEAAREASMRGDYAGSVLYLRMAADAGLAKSQYMLGVHFWNGLGVKEDRSEALRWYRMAAEAGFAAAQFELGRVFEEGLVARRDLVDARVWYARAAEQGDENAVSALKRVGPATPSSSQSRTMAAMNSGIRPAQATGPIEVALADFRQHKPLPGLPDLRQPVYLQATSLVCKSRNGLAIPDVRLALTTGTCTAAQERVRVSVLQPTAVREYIDSHFLRAVQVILVNRALSDATVRGGWVRTDDLSN